MINIRGHWITCSQKTITEIMNNVFIDAIERNDLKTIKELVQDEDIDPQFKDNYAITYACEHGYLDIIKLLLKNEMTDPMGYQEFAVYPMTYKSGFYKAIQRNRLDVIKILLKDDRIEPDHDYNKPLKISILNRNNDISKILLKNDRVIKELIHGKYFFNFNYGMDKIEAALKDHNKMDILNTGKEWNIQILPFQEMLKRDIDDILTNACRYCNLDVFATVWNNMKISCHNFKISYYHYVRCYVNAKIEKNVDNVNFLVWNVFHLQRKYFPLEYDRCILVTWLIKEMDLMMDIKDNIINRLFIKN